VAGISKRATWVGGSLLVVVLFGGAIWFIHGIVSNKENKPPHVVENVTLIRPPPPPDEPPPPPPPPDKVEEPLPQDEPPPSPDNTPAPTPQLGLDAEGSAGGDSFGLAGRPGGSDITGTGGAVFAWYTGKLKTTIADCLAADDRLRGKKYAADVTVWVEADGRIRQSRTVRGTGNRDLDSAIASDTGPACPSNDPPPLELPQPVNLHIVSRS
jgi:periplasmic protein TonB